MVMALPCGHNVLIVTLAIINVVVLHLFVYLCFGSCSCSYNSFPFTTIVVLLVG